MSKELEAFKRIWSLFDFKDMQRERSLVIKALNELEELKQEVIARQETENSLTEWVAELTNELEALKKTPTADEVCVKVTDFINGLGFVEEKIQVIYNSEDKEFYYMSKRTDDVVWYKKIVVAIQTINSTKDRTVFLDVINLPPHLITMIGKFYESLEGEK